MAGLIADNPITAVLYNADLLGFVCKDLWDIEQAPGRFMNGIRVNSLLSLALTCHVVSEIALDCLWHEICGMKPLLYLFPRGLSSDNDPAVCHPPLSLHISPDLCRYSPMSYQMIHGLGSNGTRAASVPSLSTHNCALYIHPPYSCALLRDRNLSSLTYRN